MNLAFIIFALGCASLPAPEEKSGSPEIEAGFMQPGTSFVDGTRVLVILAEKLTRNKVVQEGWVSRHWHPRLMEAGYQDTDIADGSEISAMSFCYGHNSSVGCKHQGVYFAHVPPELRDQLAVGEPGKVSYANDILEIELRMLPSKQLFGMAKQVYRHANAWGDCRMKFLASSKLYILSPSGPPVGLWLTCDGLEKEGWHGVRVRGAPLPSGTDEGESANIREWRKLPSPLQ
jgi:hypothetical protein